MFRETRRKDRIASMEDATRILKVGEYGTLATVGPDGYPYSTPISYVYYNDCIYIHCATVGHKLDNISHNNKVSFSVIGKTTVLPDKFGTLYESVVVFGEAEVVQEPEKQLALEAILDKYCSEFKKEGLEFISKVGGNTLVVKISIDRMTAKARNK